MKALVTQLRTLFNETKAPDFQKHEDMVSALEDVRERDLNPLSDTEYAFRVRGVSPSFAGWGRRSYLKISFLPVGEIDDEEHWRTEEVTSIRGTYYSGMGSSPLGAVKNLAMNLRGDLLQAKKDYKDWGRIY